MTKEKVLAWLDKQVELNEQMIANSVLNEDYERISLFGIADREVNIFGDVKKLAEIIGEPTYTVAWGNHNIDYYYKYQVYFMYKNTKFFQLLEEVDDEVN